MLSPNNFLTYLSGGWQEGQEKVVTSQEEMVGVTRCEGNVTAQTGLSASLYCCLGALNTDLGVRP